MSTIILKDTALVARLRAGLLDWYDRHGRKLKWREGGRDAYRVWLSEVMLQQTTVPHATPYYEKFLKLWPGVRDLAAADDGKVMAEWAGLGYYARARKLLECARTVVRDYDGVFPASETELLKLPGFGPYTAAAVAAIAFGLPANVVDGNIERIMTRLYAIETPLPAGKALVRDAAAQWVDAVRAGDWPQALMDMANLICRPKSPACGECTLSVACTAKARGDQERFPVKLAKAPKPRRHGVAYVMLNGDRVIVERRPDKGLLGGMLGLPHAEWRAEPYGAPEVRWRLAGSYEHVFTHFALTQQVWVKAVSEAEATALLRDNNAWQWMHVGEKALPTVFAKALKLKDARVEPDLFR
ncbi:A/G-specific adenine glycosylase [Asticcacaulis sp. 201]|uniref:A/G-specific adenine glycosylase n=1 Tax=Asticcacaulis sp. 201 TaxID=3028787 RepID=UPI002916C85E|nr:A/G-specific adenine glycosylase [Asticcacaulis sp. 201]MDV6329782.1 A/G-specific adenine glycosylase [Asticcacaulis sp. 201]